MNNNNDRLVILRGLVDAMPGLEFVSCEEGPYLIVSDGLSINTKVYYEGIALKNICEVEIMPIVPDEYVRARITVIMPRLNILANVDFSDHK